MGFGYGRKTSHNSSATNIATGERVAKVLSNSMVAHVWAQRVQTFGQSSNGNLYFEGPTLYSYGSHYVLAHILDSGVVLVNSDKASVTTSQHHSDAWRATRHMTRVYVPDLTSLMPALRMQAGPERKHYIEAHVKKHVLAMESDAFRALMVLAGHCVDQIGAMFAKWQAAARADELKRSDAAKAFQAKQDRERAKRIADATDSEFAAHMESVLKDSYFRNRDDSVAGRAKSFNGDLLRYQRAAKSEGWTRIAATVAARRKTWLARLDWWTRKKQIANRNAYDRSQINLIRADLARLKSGFVLDGSYRYRQLADACRHLLRDFNDKLKPVKGLSANGVKSLEMIRDAALVEYARIIPIEREHAAKVKAQAAALRHAKEAEDRAAWLAGRNVPGFRGSDEKGRALIRAERVEIDATGAIVSGTLRTSHGAEVPLTHALRAFAFVKLCHETGRTWKANGRTIKVGHFTISEVTPDGFTAGCHTIGWTECERLARALDVLDLPASESALVPSRETEDA